MSVLQAADPRVLSLIEQAKDGTRIVSIVDTIITLLEEQHLVYRVSLPPPLVGIHPANRDGYGVSVAEVHELGAELVDLGFSWLACAHATAEEDDEQGSFEKFSSDIKEKTPKVWHQPKMGRFGLHR